MKQAWYERYVVKDGNGRWLTDDGRWTTEPTDAAEYDSLEGAQEDADGIGIAARERMCETVDE